MPLDEPAVKPVLDFHWMPFTANRDFKREPKLVARAEGIYYYDPSGRAILDGASGLFSTPAGHGRREIAEAVHRQLLDLDYTPSFTRGHQNSFVLAERLAKLLPAGLERIFFCNSGSEAVETAMKIALAYHRARKEPERTIFVSRESAYHGVNFGGVALSGLTNNRRSFGTSLPAALHIRHTRLPENRFVKGEAAHGAELAEDLAHIAEMVGPENVAAVFVEPIAGSAGALVPPVGYLARLREIADRYGILLVFDEVITGFGRTGRAFAAESFGVRPDIITMAKALTNGAQPMGAVASRRDIYEAIVDTAPEGGIEFFHGYTFSAHPAACAAALTAITIYREESLFERAQQMSAYFLDALFTLQDVPVVSDIRGYGMLGGIDLAPASRLGARGHDLQKRLFDAGLHLKATGDTLIIAPAFVTEIGQLDQMMDILRQTAKSL